MLTEGCWFTPRNNLFLQLWKPTAIYNQIKLKNGVKHQITSPHLTSPRRHNMYNMFYRYLFSTGILMLIPVGTFANYNSIFRSVSTALTTSSISLGVPYGLIVGCLGACLVLLASLSLLLLICRNNRQQPPIVYAAPLGPFGGAQVQVTTGYPTTQPIGVYPPATYPNIPPPEQDQDSRNNTPFGYNRF